MAFPNTFNISYYKGDTYEFRIYPKDSSGAPFDLSGYLNSNIKFTIATQAGSVGVPEQKLGFVEKSGDDTYILCAITPEVGNQLAAGTTYLYDIEIAADATPYDRVFTLLTGQITVTEQITQPYTLGV